MSAWTLVIVRDSLRRTEHSGARGHASVRAHRGPDEVIEVAKGLAFGCEMIDYGGTQEWCSIDAALSVLDAVAYVRITTTVAYEGGATRPEERWWRIDAGSMTAVLVPRPPEGLAPPIATANDDGQTRANWARDAATPGTR